MLPCACKEGLQSCRKTSAVDRTQTLRLALLALIWISLVGCTHPRSSIPEVDRAAAAAQPFIRVTEPKQRQFRLEIAARRFTPPRGTGPSVWLVGVCHLGDPAYYQAVESLLASQGVVLYEGVRPESSERPRATPSEQAAQRRYAEESLQGSMARSLGLVFQLAVVDYTRPNFVHSDLSLDEMNTLLTAQAQAEPSKAQDSDSGDSSGKPEFDALVAAMDNSSSLNRILRALLGLLESNDHLQTLAKWAMLQMMGEVGDNLEGVAKINPGMDRLLKVLLKARNDHVIRDVLTQVKTRRGRSGVAVFYGAGHMRDLATRLVGDLGYRQSEERWLPAFDVDLDAAGISAFEERLVRSALKAQLDALRAP